MATYQVPGCRVQVVSSGTRIVAETGQEVGAEDHTHFLCGEGGKQGPTQLEPQISALVTGLHQAILKQF